MLHFFFLLFPTKPTALASSSYVLLCVGTRRTGLSSYSLIDSTALVFGFPPRFLLASFFSAQNCFHALKISLGISFFFLRPSFCHGTEQLIRLVFTHDLWFFHRGLRCRFSRMRSRPNHSATASTDCKRHSFEPLGRIARLLLSQRRSDSAAMERHPGLEFFRHKHLSRKTFHCAGFQPTPAHVDRKANFWCNRD